MTPNFVRPVAPLPCAGRPPQRKSRPGRRPATSEATLPGNDRIARLAHAMIRRLKPAARARAENLARPRSDLKAISAAQAPVPPGGGTDPDSLRQGAGRSRSAWARVGSGVFPLLLGTACLWGGGGALEIRNGYLWDPRAGAAGDYFIPRGFAYQSWNPPVGANQSFAQLDYDLTEFKKMYANSVRCEFVWGEVAVDRKPNGEVVYDWSKPDHLVQVAERLGLRLFVIIGFQYPPAWFPPELRGINDQGLTPDVLECIARQRGTPGVTNCLPPPMYDCLTTNRLPAEVITLTLNCLASSDPAQIVGCLQANVPEEHRRTVLSCFISDVINYEHPEARRLYTNHIAAVASRYKDRAAIGAWIMGNEYAYFDLWESPTIYTVHRFIGYDPQSIAAFRAYLRTAYSDSIAALNANWGTSYARFDAVAMPRFFPKERNNPAFHDLIQWRQQSIGHFIAAGTRTARQFDPNHLLTYSMVGGIFNGNDANNTCEDAVAIVSACQAAGAPLDFWSINNYAWAAYGSELRTGDFGISKYQELVGLPVMISETGHSSTEDLFPAAGPRQAKALPGQVWEALMSGALGAHIFHWSDRNQFVRGYFYRERGFGVVQENRQPKEPVYGNVLALFRRMENIKIEKLLGGSRHPPPDIQFYWSKAGDLGWPRANQENAMIWGALKRLGFQLALLDDAEFRAGAYRNAPALLLSRCGQLEPADLDRVATDVLNAGVHVHANADLPGQFDTYLRPNPNWPARMKSVFGIDVANAVAAYDSGAVRDETTNLVVRGASPLGELNAGWSAEFTTWKFWHGVKNDSGTVVLTHTGLNQSQNNPPVPALVIKTLGSARTAVNTFGVADIFAWVRTPAEDLWRIRYDILRAIYRDHFRLAPAIDISGPGRKHVLPDYRLCANGSVLISLLNEHTATAAITLSAKPLLTGKTVESITGGRLLETNSDGVLDFTLTDDEYVLLYAYDTAGGRDQSLLNPSPQKLWFEQAPLVVWPRPEGFTVELSYDTRGQAMDLVAGFERVHAGGKLYSVTGPARVTGRGRQAFSLRIPDPDLNEPEYRSTPEGGQYVFRAWLEQDGALVSDSTLPVRLVWGTRPLSLPAAPGAGATYSITNLWQELPSQDPNDPMPLDRAALWDSLAANTQHYNVVIELQDGAGRVIAASTNVTRQGAGTNVFTLTVPAGAQGPFRWTTTLQSAPGTGSRDLFESFEGRERGADHAPFHPWFAYAYADNPAAPPRKLSEGVQLLEPDNNRVAYVVVDNPPDRGRWSGFGLIYGTPAEFALPSDKRLWSNYLFGFDFKRVRGGALNLELQLKDVNNNWLQFTNTYHPDANGWATLRATLDKFSQPRDQPRPFDSRRVRYFALNIAMSQAGTIYEGQFDNVRFSGPPVIADDFDDRNPGENRSRIAPWEGYGYDDGRHNDIKLDQGVHLEASDGSQSAFLVAWWPADSPFAGFGLFRRFPQKWALPANKRQWADYTLSFDFKERSGRKCLLQLSIQNEGRDAQDRVRGLHFTKEFPAGTTGWFTVSASLDRFVQPDYYGPFDPTQFDRIVLNVQMQEQDASAITPSVIYVASFDRIRFDGPEVLAPGVATYSVYSSANDFFGVSRFDPLTRALTLLLPAGAFLESAAEVTGPWRIEPGVVSPFNVLSVGPRKFYRLRP